jgi:hypothetical protein
MPNKENIQKWVDTLRSDEFKQTKDALKNEDGYCCLGVACEVYGKENNVTFNERDYFLGVNDVLPSSVQEWFDLPCGNPYFGGERATTHNDEHRRTFAEIADLIEAEYLKEDA